MIRGFTDEHVPDLTGRTFFVTGANTGIGLEVARVLARRGARVLLGCRSAERARAAMDELRSGAPDADVEVVPLDLADLGSVRDAAARVLAEPRLDALVNNAGVLGTPRQLTKDGFELHLGVNHLGPFALTGLLLPALEATADSRIVNTASNGHRLGEPDFDDLQAERSYSRWRRYGASKLANLLHTYELDRRLRARGSHVRSVAAHPGGADTEVARHMPWLGVTRPLFRWMVNSAAQAAWPTLLAATHDGVEGGQYFGPQGPGQMKGPAGPVGSSARSRDPALARRLWDVSVALTGVDPGI